jgi:class 3 adenylate cyclase
MSKLKSDLAKLTKTERDGEYFQATEVAYRLLRKHYLDDKGNLHSGRIDESYRDLTYVLTRAVLNCRAVDRANTLYYGRYKLHQHRDHMNIRSLGARLVKERALRATGDTRVRLLKDAAKAYADVYEDFGTERGYTAVNVATLTMLYGDEDSAAEWAKIAIGHCEAEHPTSSVATYYNAATAAEAALVLGDLAQTVWELNRAAFAGLEEKATRATTLRQLKLICAHKGLNADEILAAIRIPDIMFYAGHIIAPPGETGRFPAETEASVKKRIEDWLDTHQVSSAYGSLAAGADILFAEACLERDINLHVILPFSADEFLETSVARSGDNWVHRFEFCMAKCAAEAADSCDVSYATKDAFLNDEVLFEYGSRYAMGVAMLHAGHLTTSARLVAVYDGRNGSGLDVDIIDLESAVEPQRQFLAAEQASELPKRVPKAVMFGDVVGFSKLREQDIPRFHSDFMGLISGHLKSYEDRIRCRNSWGDAIYIVFHDVVDAARFGLEIQSKIEDLKFIPDGADSPLSLRLAIHYGPVFDGVDGFIQTPSCFGAHVTHAARIEPVTPPGVVYVTEAMAAELKLIDEEAVTCDFVGPISSAKGFGDMLLYALRENTT